MCAACVRRAVDSDLVSGRSDPNAIAATAMATQRSGFPVHDILEFGQSLPAGVAPGPPLHQEYRVRSDRLLPIHYATA